MTSSETIAPARIDKVFKVLIIGGAYAGLAAVTTLLDVCNAQRCRFADDEEAENTPLVPVDIEVTLIDERDGYYHLIGSPLAFASEKYTSVAWKCFEDVPGIQDKKVQYLHGSVLSVDNCNKAVHLRQHEATQLTIVPYDYLIVASGLSRNYPSVPQSKTRTKYLAETKKHIDLVRNAEKGVVVIGGGAVGVEMAAELKLCEPNQRVTLIHSRESLLSSENLPDEFKDRTLEILRATGVDVILNDRVIDTIESKDPSGKPLYTLVLKDGSRFETGHVINAISGFHPTSTFLPPAALDEQGYVKIDPNLRFSSEIDNSAYHFAAGDISKWSGIKRCGSAMHQGHLAAVNVYLSILESEGGYKVKFLELDDVPPMMGLAIGRQAVTFSGAEGVKSGEERMKWYFGEDLAHTICWNYMRLGESRS